MSKFNTSTNHPLIPSSNEYMIEQRVVSIHSEDRDFSKYPNSSEFEIELPDDYVNVSTVKLGTYTFPSNYNTFSLLQSNIILVFKFDKIYNPSDYGYYDPVLNAIYDALQNNIDNEYYISIEEGFYTPTQIDVELTNQFNEQMNVFLIKVFSGSNPSIIPEFISNGGYNQFQIVYNLVNQKLWFGNKSSSFTIVNSSKFYNVIRPEIQTMLNCRSPIYSCTYTWGLPAYLGFTRCDTPSITNTQPGKYPRFMYGDAVENSGDKGYWLLPDPSYIGLQTVNYLETPSKINLMGNSYFYMEIAGLNNIDETMPFYSNQFTSHTNETNSVHNSAFAKIGVITTPLSQWYDNNTEAIKIFNPPAERIRKIKLRLRYHNGALVNFGQFNYSFNLIFNILRPQTLRSYMSFDPTASSISGVSNVVAKR